MVRVSTQGGTSLGPSRLPWIAAGAAVIVLVLGILLWPGGGDPEGEAAAALAADAGDDIEIAEDEPELAAEPEADPAEDDDPFARVAAAKSAAAQSLETLLSGRRLWSKVSVDELEPEVVVVRSAACEDPAMRPALAEARDALVEAGFARLRCVARHGGQVFEEPL